MCQTITCGALFAGVAWVAATATALVNPGHALVSGMITGATYGFLDNSSTPRPITVALSAIVSMGLTYAAFVYSGVPITFEAAVILTGFSFVTAITVATVSGIILCALTLCGLAACFNNQEAISQWVSRQSYHSY